MSKLILAGLIFIGLLPFTSVKAQSGSGIDILFLHDSGGNQVKRKVACPTCPPDSDDDGERRSQPKKDIEETPNTPETKFGIKAFPNPTDKDVTVVIDNFENVKEQANLVLSDEHGKTLQQFRITKKQTLIDMSNCAEGVYYLNVVADDEKLSYTVIKKH